MAQNGQDEQRLGLFIDFENIAIGVRDAHYRKFDINLVLERLLDKGKLLVKKAYADWSRYSDYKRSFHEAAIELIEVPQKSVGGKNSADIRLVVDAMDMSFQKEHINCFVIASGDSDFSPLVSKLKENDKHVIGLGVKNSTSDLLIENCDEFIFYEDLVRAQQRPLPQMGSLPDKLHECFALLVDAVLALQRENKELLWGSMVKETMKRKKPSFNETYYGFRTFSHLLEDAQRRGIVKLRRDQRSGSYIIEDLGSAATVAQAAGVGAHIHTARPESNVLTALSRPAEAPAATSVAAVANGLAPGGSSTGASAAAESPAAESANGSRPASRRRRGGRGRRPRAASPLAAGAYPDHSDQHAHQGDDGEADDGPEGDDDGDDQTEERESSAEPSASSSSPHPAPPAEPAPTAERAPFSLFSWMRRDDEKKPE